MIPYFLAFLSPGLVLLAAQLGGPAALIPPLVLFGIVPSIDQWLPLNRENQAGPASLRLLPLLYVPVHLVVLTYALHAIVSAPSLVGGVLLTLSCGIGTALAINVAHELMHRAGRVEQGLAAVIMATASYTHFCVEHVQGHHKNVGTPRDPATSRLGETLYAYLPRTLWGGLRSAWRIEAARPIPRNRMLRFAVGYAALLVAITVTFGPLGIVAFLGQSLVAVGMLETINYVEHYGLVRGELATGRPERVAPHHSWNSAHRVANWMLFNLARHSDHHAYAGRPFPELRHYDDVPQLPASYPAMMLLAAVPPLWFRVMNPRAERARAMAA